MFRKIKDVYGYIMGESFERYWSGNFKGESNNIRDDKQSAHLSVIMKNLLQYIEYLIKLD